MRLGLPLIAAMLLIIATIHAQISQPGGVQVPNGNYDVYDSTGGVHIGDCTVNGGTIGYVDDPTTDHRPNQNGVFNWNSSLGGYDSSSNSDHIVYFNKMFDNTVWVWVKRSKSTGAIIDQGTLG